MLTGEGELAGEDTGSEIGLDMVQEEGHMYLIFCLNSNPLKPS